MIKASFYDEFCVAKHLDIPFLLSFFQGLNINVLHEKIVNFLDLNISVDVLTNSFYFSLYIKKTNTFSYLLTSSNHPLSIKKNIPKSLFIRIRRICSSFIDYLYFSHLLITQLISRGYTYKFLIKICYAILNTERNSLLPYKKRVKSPFINFFVLP